MSKKVKNATWVGEVEQFAHDQSMVGQSVTLHVGIMHGKDTTAISAYRGACKKLTVGEQPLARWEIPFCRKYGFKSTTLFCIDAGRRSECGPGAYHFQLKKPDGLMERIKHLLEPMQHTAKPVIAPVDTMSIPVPLPTPQPTPIPPPELTYSQISIGDEPVNVTLAHNEEDAQPTGSKTQYITIDIQKTAALTNARNNTRRVMSRSTSVADPHQKPTSETPPQALSRSISAQPTSAGANYVNLTLGGLVAKHTIDDDLDSLMNEVDTEMAKQQPPPPLSSSSSSSSSKRQLSSRSHSRYMNIPDLSKGKPL